MPTPIINRQAAHIGERLRALRGDRGLVAWRVAMALEMSPDGYRHYETGRSSIRAQDIPRWARAFGVTTDYFVRFIGLVDEPPGDPGEALTEDVFRRRLADEYGPEISVEFQRLFESVRVGPKSQKIIASVLRGMREAAQPEEALP